MRRLGVVAMLALFAVAGCGAGHQGALPQARPENNSSGPATRTGAPAVEMGAARAESIAEREIGNCLLGAWGNRGLNNITVHYYGGGLVEFDAQGSAGASITVKVAPDGTVKASPAMLHELAHLGCKLGSQVPSTPQPEADATWRWTCQITYFGIGATAHATVTATGNAPVPADSLAIAIARSHTFADGNTLPLPTWTVNLVYAEIRPGQTITLWANAGLNDSVTNVDGCSVVSQG